MANILITNHCPRKCSFCFARSKIGQVPQKKGSTIMTRENLRKVMDFLACSGERNLRLLGGEPTLHPEFNEIVAEALAGDFHVHIFSNCMMPKQVADFLGRQPKEKISVLANVSPQAHDTARQLEKVAYALEQLGPRAQVGITLTEPEFEYQFLLKYIDRFKLRRRIRIGIAQPIVGISNQFLQPSRYKETGTAITNMAIECVKHDVLIGFDCGLTLCMFTPEQIGILSRTSEGFKAICRPIIDIGPDLSVWHCFPLSEILNTGLEKFKNRNQISRFYDKQTFVYRTFGCMPECIQCEYLRRGQCTGGCLAHTLNSLDRLPPKKLEHLY